MNGRDASIFTAVLLLIPTALLFMYASAMPRLEGHGCDGTGESGIIYADEESDLPRCDVIIPFDLTRNVFK
jgi:hypothetical protein